MSNRIPNWTTATWLLGFLWLFLAMWGNTPFFQPHPKTNPQFDLRGFWVESRKMKQPTYEYTALVGWPINYAHIEKPLYRISKFSILALLANVLCVVLAITTLTSLSERYLKKFSIRFLFLLTAMVAVLITVLPYITPDWGIIVFINGMVVLFILPICIYISIGLQFTLKRKEDRQNAT